MGPDGATSIATCLSNEGLISLGVYNELSVDYEGGGWAKSPSSPRNGRPIAAGGGPDAAMELVAAVFEPQST
jgi:hypothetical protein